LRKRTSSSGSGSAASANGSPRVERMVSIYGTRPDYVPPLTRMTSARFGANPIDRRGGRITWDPSVQPKQKSEMVARPTVQTIDRFVSRFPLMADGCCLFVCLHRADSE
jgi:hypothetical protein